MVTKHEFDRQIRRAARRELLLGLWKRKWLAAASLLIPVALVFGIALASSPLVLDETQQGRVTGSFAAETRFSQHLELFVTLEGGQQVRVALPKRENYRPDALVEVKSYRRALLPGRRFFRFSSYVEEG